MALIASPNLPLSYTLNLPFCSTLNDSSSRGWAFLKGYVWVYSADWGRNMSQGLCEAEKGTYTFEEFFFRVVVHQSARDTGCALC